MVTKPRQESPEHTAQKQHRIDNPLAGDFRVSARQVWLAGLGAFAKAQQEGGRVFEALVREGRELQQRGRGRADTESAGTGHAGPGHAGPGHAAGAEPAEPAPLGGSGGVTDRIALMAGGLSRQASASWERLEQAFEARVARTLGRLGVPTRDDVQTLIERIDALDARIRALGETPAGRPAGKTAARPAAQRAGAPKASRTTRSRAAQADADQPMPGSSAPVRRR